MTLLFSMFHTETRTGEAFLRNCDAQLFSQLQFKTARMGLKAFDGKGNPLNEPDWHPVFLRQSELNALGMTEAQAAEQITSLAV